MRSLKRTILTTATLLVVGAGSLAAVTIPAEASAGQGFVSGSGETFDDWDDEGTLSRRSFANSNATALWQWILYADGAAKPNGAPFSQNDIDCQFGPTTEAATKSWQRDWNGRHPEAPPLAVDGLVGPMTFGAAGDKLVALANGIVIYSGNAHSAAFPRTNGQYKVVTRKGAFVAWYRSRSAC